MLQALARRAVFLKVIEDEARVAGNRQGQEDSKFSFVVHPLKPNTYLSLTLRFGRALLMCLFPSWVLDTNICRESSKRLSISINWASEVIDKFAPRITMACVTTFDNIVLGLAGCADNAANPLFSILLSFS